MKPDDAARAASDAIDAWCAAHPAPAWQAPQPGEARVYVGNVPARVEVTYARFPTREEIRRTFATNETLAESIAEIARLTGFSEDAVRTLVENAAASHWSHDV